MATQYAYKVRDSRGRSIQGTVGAESQAAVAERLRSMGYVPLEIRETNAGMQRDINIGLPKRIGLKDLAVFGRQFSTMIDAGLSMLRALTILAEQTEHPELKKVLRAVRQDVETGSSLSAAFSRHDAFPPLMVSMTRAGEAGGFLDVTLRQVADNFEKEVKLRSKVKAALTYPVVVFVMAIVMCAAMLLFVVPVFEKMFADLGGTLPLPTQILVMLSQGLKYAAPIIVVVLLVAGVWWRKNGKKQRVREVVDPLKLKIPVFGQLFHKIALARFARNLSTLLSSGVPILQSLEIVGETTGTVVIGHALDDVRESVRHGESVSAPLANHEVFPPMVVQMIASGEESGSIDAMLGKIAEFYDQEVEATTESLTALIEPLMIGLLGGVVGSMIVALYLPIFNVFELIG